MATPVNSVPGIVDRTPIKSSFDGYQRLKNDHELFLEAYESKNKLRILVFTVCPYSMSTCNCKFKRRRKCQKWFDIYLKYYTDVHTMHSLHT